MKGSLKWDAKRILTLKGKNKKLDFIKMKDFYLPKITLRK